MFLLPNINESFLMKPLWTVHSRGSVYTTFSGLQMISRQHLCTEHCCQAQAIRFARQFGTLTCMWKGDSITGALHIIVKWGHLTARVCSPTVYLQQRSIGLILFHWFSIKFLWVPVSHQPATTDSLQGWVKVTRPQQPMHYGLHAHGQNDLILLMVL